MKYFAQVLLGVVLLFVAAPLTAGEAIIYGGSQKPGTVSWGEASPINVIGNLRDLKGDFGGTLGIRYSAGRVIGFEQNIGFSPSFGTSGIKAFYTGSNLLVQAPGKIVPYGSVGVGLFRTWGTNPVDLDDPQIDAGKIAQFAFDFGTSFAVNYGGGVKVRNLWGPLGINVDVRGFTLPNVSVNVDGRKLEDQSLSLIQTTAGLVISW
jgi:hypothetical protein